MSINARINLFNKSILKIHNFFEQYLCETLKTAKERHVPALKDF